MVVVVVVFLTRRTASRHSTLQTLGFFVVVVVVFSRASQIQNYILFALDEQDHFRANQDCRFFLTTKSRLAFFCLFS